MKGARRPIRCLLEQSDLQIFDAVMMGIFASSHLVCRLNELIDVLKVWHVMSHHHASNAEDRDTY